MKLPNDKAGLYLIHNEHKGYYESASQWLSNKLPQPSWKSEASKAAAIETDEIWTLQWYPRTPVGFNYIAAPTLEELLEFADELEKEEEKP